MTCPTVKKLGTLAIEKFDVLSAINAHLMDVFEGAANCCLINQDYLQLRITDHAETLPNRAHQEVKTVLGALAEGWKPIVCVVHDFTGPRQG